MKKDELAELIRETPGCVTSVVPIGNEAYNRLYTKMRSVNTLLAWGHARVIENLMGQQHRMNPPPVRAISDQFAADKATVGKALMSLGRGIELVQRHKAEEDMAVAAASILARNEFVTRLANLEKQFEMKLPKGASAAVDSATREFSPATARRISLKLPKPISAPRFVRRVCLTAQGEMAAARMNDPRSVDRCFEPDFPVSPERVFRDSRISVYRGSAT